MASVWWLLWRRRRPGTAAWRAGECRVTPLPTASGGAWRRAACRQWRRQARGVSDGRVVGGSARCTAPAVGGGARLRRAAMQARGGRARLVFWASAVFLVGTPGGYCRCLDDHAHRTMGKGGRGGNKARSLGRMETKGDGPIRPSAGCPLALWALERACPHSPTGGGAAPRWLSRTRPNAPAQFADRFSPAAACWTVEGAPPSL